MKVEELLAHSASEQFVNPYTAALADYLAPEQRQTSKTGIKFVYFDLHQVLVHSTKGLIPFLAAACGQSVKKVEELYMFYNADLCLGKLSMAEFNQILSRELETPHLNWQDFYLRHTRPDSAIQAAFEWISQNYPVGLFTNAFGGNVSQLMEQGTIPSKYAVIVDSSVVGQIKPALGVYQYAHKQAGVRAEEILLIDDQLINISSARASGWQGFWVNDESRVNIGDRLREILDF